LHSLTVVDRGARQLSWQNKGDKCSHAHAQARHDQLKAWLQIEHPAPATFRRTIIGSSCKHLSDQHRGRSSKEGSQSQPLPFWGEHRRLIVLLAAYILSATYPVFVDYPRTWTSEGESQTIKLCNWWQQALTRARFNQCTGLKLSLATEMGVGQLRAEHNHREACIYHLIRKRLLVHLRKQGCFYQSKRSSRFWTHGLRYKAQVPAKQR
jgi:hypothetical protein